LEINGIAAGSLTAIIKQNFMGFPVARKAHEINMPEKGLDTSPVTLNNLADIAYACARHKHQDKKCN